MVSIVAQSRTPLQLVGMLAMHRPSAVREHWLSPHAADELVMPKEGLVIGGTRLRRRNVNDFAIGQDMHIPTQRRKTLLANELPFFALRCPLPRAMHTIH